MLDIGATELLMIVVVAVVVIGPKDLPLALRTAGKWIGKMRRLSNHFRSGLDAMVREAEMEDMEKKWREQNERIKREHPADALPEAERTGALPAPAASAESASEASAAAQTAPFEPESGPGLPPPSAPAESREARDVRLMRTSRSEDHAPFLPLAETEAGADLQAHPVAEPQPAPSGHDADADAEEVRR